MKKAILALLMIVLGNQIFTQDFEKKVHILKKIFLQNELVEINQTDVLKTKVRGKYANIPINSSSSFLLKMSEDLSVLAFTIYLSENEKDYQLMHENDINNTFDIVAGSDLMRLMNNERFVQVVYFDNKEDKFIAKPEGFPIEGLRWVPEGMGDLSEFVTINKLVQVENSNDACVLYLYECPSCNSNIYVFKRIGDKILSSNKYAGCFEKFIEEPNQIKCKEITNCYEVEYDDIEPEYKSVTLLKW